jgi:predicted dienelactone hydrolase
MQPRVQTSNRLPSLLRAAIGALFLLATMPGQAASEEATRIGGIDVVVWTPSTGEQLNLPVLVFSHALYLCPTQSRYLTRALADAGYLVIAPRHGDSSCTYSIWPSLSRWSAKPSLMWTEDDYRDRADDIRKVVDALARDARYRDAADLGRLALAGHSLGGYTVLGLGGAWPSWRLPGVRAIMALTPYSLPFQHSDGLSRLSVPTMYQVGTLDPVFTLPIEQFGYARTPSPKYLVEISWANHLAWTDLGMSGRDAIVDYAIAFLDHYVKDAPEAAALKVALPGVSGYRRD